jgi:CheY-like chemotaxis protein
VQDMVGAGERIPTMLIADDDPGVERLLAERCTLMGFQVDTAANGMRLLTLARQTKPDVMIVDVNIPVLDGLSASLRLLEPGAKDVDVILITGYPTPDIAERCESLGVFFGLKGPNFWKSLQAALSEIFPKMADKIGEVAAASAKVEIPLHPRVLVVDDDPQTKEFFATRLGKYGLDTVYAPDPVHGYRLALKHQPVAIVSNYKIADGNAFYLLHRLRSTPETGNVPVFVLSDDKIDPLTAQTLKREIRGRPGATHVLNKAAETDELFQALQKYTSFVDMSALKNGNGNGNN